MRVMFIFIFVQRAYLYSLISTQIEWFGFVTCLFHVLNMFWAKIETFRRSFLCVKLQVCYFWSQNVFARAHTFGLCICDAGAVDISMWWHPTKEYNQCKCVSCYLIAFLSLSRSTFLLLLFGFSLIHVCTDTRFISAILIMKYFYTDQWKTTTTTPQMKTIISWDFCLSFRKFSMFFLICMKNVMCIWNWLPIRMRHVE